MGFDKGGGIPYFTMKTHKTMLKNQSVFSYPWVARISCLRLSAPVCACLRLSAPVCVRWCIGRCVGAQADALVHRQIRWRTGRFGPGHAGLEKRLPLEGRK